MPSLINQSNLGFTFFVAASGAQSHVIPPPEATMVIFPFFAVRVDKVGKHVAVCFESGTF